MTPSLLIVGNWRWPQYEAAFARGLEASGARVAKLALAERFTGKFGHLQQKIPVPGPAMWRINRAVITSALDERPETILFWRPTHIAPSTLRKLRALGIRTISYNNDDPFGPRVHKKAPWHHHALWFWYIRSLCEFEFNFFYRKINCLEALAEGARHAAILLPYFMPWQDRPLTLTEAERSQFEADATFIGHYEPDGRVEMLSALLAAGMKVRLWGDKYWTPRVLGPLYDKLTPIRNAFGDDYARAICGSKVALCFLSKLNRDTYTRRCFEIPACGRPMLAERTDDLMRLFEDNKEACFFSSTEELVRKARWLIDRPDVSEEIGKAGFRRVWRDGHDVISRARGFLSGVLSPQVLESTREMKGYGEQL